DVGELAGRHGSPPLDMGPHNRRTPNPFAGAHYAPTGVFSGPRPATTEGNTMARVTGLGHVGIYVRDLERMVAFYRDVMGMRITKQNWRVGIVFLSADPDAVDHEIALMRGRPDATDPHLIQQISMRVASLDDLRAFHRRLVADGYRIEEVVNHASAIGCYFFDPEGNRTAELW